MVVSFFWKGLEQQKTLQVSMCKFMGLRNGLAGDLFQGAAILVRNITEIRLSWYGFPRAAVP